MSTLSRIADNVGDAVSDAISTSKDFVTDIASGAADRAPDVVDKVGSIARTGVDKARSGVEHVPDVASDAGHKANLWARTAVSLLPFVDVRPARGGKSLVRRAAPYLALAAVAAAVVYWFRGRGGSNFDQQATGYGRVAEPETPADIKAAAQRS